MNNVSPTWEVLPTVGRSMSFMVVVRDNATGGGKTDRISPITLTVDANSGPFVVTIPSLTGISWQGGSSQAVTWNVTNTNIAPVSCANVDIFLSTDGGLTYPTTIATSVTNTGSATITVPNIATTTARIMVRGAGRAFFDISNSNFTITNSPCPATRTLTTDITSGMIISKAIQTITATNKIFSPANVTYQAGKSIMLNTGFEAKNGSVFLAEIAGCN